MGKGPSTFDVIVVGAGPAGLAAASIAAEHGLRVAVIEATPWLGGQIWRGEQARPSSAQAQRWFARLQASGAEVLLNTAAVAAPVPGVLLAESPDGAMEIRWQRLVLAVGARELLLPFPGWTLPGVIGAGGLQALVKAGWPVAGKRIVVAGSGPLLFAVAANLRQDGAKVVQVTEQTPWTRLIGFGMKLPFLAPSKLIQAAEYQLRLLGIGYRAGCWPVSVQGKDHVEAVTLRAGRRTWTIPCDVLACGFNLVPNLEMPHLMGCRIEDDVVCVNPWQETSVPNVYCAGEPTGVGGVDRAIVEGQIAGYAIACEKDRAKQLFGSRGRARRFTEAMDRGFALRQEVRHLAQPDTIVCRCEDVRLRQLEPYDTPQAAKLHTRCGMGTCQGRICGAALRALFGWEGPSVRPPIFPARIDTLMHMEVEPPNPPSLRKEPHEPPLETQGHSHRESEASVSHPGLH